ncbi:MAG: hypothetical protein JWN22_3687 [Nocardioides sp.]|jgi:uncharacterized protein YukE|nr:hypothetical protein [Nocardioides sp.]
MSSSNVEVHPDDLQQIVDLLDTTGQTLFDRAPDLDQAPDAGASSGEVSEALASLASAVAGLAQHLGSLSSSTGATLTDFTGTDQAVSGAMRRREGVLGP